MKLSILGGGGFRVPADLPGPAGRPRRGPGHPRHAARPRRPAAGGDPAGAARAGRRRPRRAAGRRSRPTSTRRWPAPTSSSSRSGSSGLAGPGARRDASRCDEGVLGQETVGAGGISYGLRTLPVVDRIARRIAAVAPDAWVINFTNPAGMVTEAMSPHLGDRVIGICDSPVGLGRRVAGALGIDPDRGRFDYAGLNHLGWLRAVRVDGQDVLPAAARRRRTALDSFEEGKLFGATWLRSAGRDPQRVPALLLLQPRGGGRRPRGGQQTRGAFLLRPAAALLRPRWKPATGRRSTPGTAPGWSGRRPTWRRTARRSAAASATPATWSPAATSRWRWP